MYAATLRSDALPQNRDAALQRADGEIRLGFRRRGDVTVLDDLYQRSPGRVLLPRIAAGAVPEAVLLNTAGGLTGGDRMALSVGLEGGASAVVTTQAAEKIYRAIDGEARVATSLTVEADATLEWLPQETIIFNGARLRRRLGAEISGNGRLLAAECLVLGRTAHGESLKQGRLHDEWRIRRDGRLLWADALHLDGDIAARVADPALLNGALAFATLLFAAKDAAAWLEPVRALAPPMPVRSGATLLGEVLLIRALSSDAARLRDHLGDLVGLLRSEALGHAARLPKMWLC